MSEYVSPFDFPLESSVLRNDARSLDRSHRPKPLLASVVLSLLLLLPHPAELEPAPGPRHWRTPTDTGLSVTYQLLFRGQRHDAATA